MSRRAITKDDPVWDWWHKAAPPSDLMPLVLENGLELEELTGGCRACDLDADPSETRAEIRNHDAITFWVRMGSVCRKCRTLHIDTLLIRPAGKGMEFVDISTEAADPFQAEALGRGRS